MSKNESRVKKAMDIVLERQDYIMNYYTTPDFVDCHSSKVQQHEEGLSGS